MQELYQSLSYRNSLSALAAYVIHHCVKKKHGHRSAFQSLSSELDQTRIWNDGSCAFNNRPSSPIL